MVKVWWKYGKRGCKRLYNNDKSIVVPVAEQISALFQNFSSLSFVTCIGYAPARLDRLYLFLSNRRTMHRKKQILLIRALFRVSSPVYNLFR
jgi:hypothetical protein